MTQARAAGGHAMGAARDLRGAARHVAYAAGQAGAVAHVAARTRHGRLCDQGGTCRCTEGGGDAAGRVDCRWQRDQLPAAFHDSVAAITAYLSLLEHQLVLALPFKNFDPTKDDVTEVISSRWGEKFDRVLGKEGKAARYRQRLIAVVERWRNPYSHGGFEKGHGATIYLHTPGVNEATITSACSVTLCPPISVVWNLGPVNGPFLRARVCAGYGAVSEHVHVRTAAAAVSS